MPKMKTHKGAVKRFKKTGQGKIVRRRALMRHLLTGKRRKRKRTLRRAALVESVDADRVKRLVPYWKKQL